MAVPSSGELKLWNSIWNPEIGGSKGDNSLHSASVYAGFSTPDAMSDFYGWSDVEAPTVSTSGASSVTQSSMTANGNVSNTGGENVTRGFYFGTSTTYTSNTKYTISGTQGTGGFSRSMTGLSAGTTYRINAWAANSGGETVGSQVSQATYVNFTKSLAGQQFFSGHHAVSFGAPVNAGHHGQYNDPNVGYITYAGYSGTQYNNWNNPGCYFNNATYRGYASTGYPTGTCPTIKTNNGAVLVQSAGGFANSSNAGGSGCNVCAASYPNGASAQIQGSYYVVHPVHWANRVNSAHAVHYRNASDIRLKTNITYL